LEFAPAEGLNDNGEGVQEFADFMTLLAPPPRGPITVAAILGEHQFSKIGCASCHTPTLITGPSPVAALHYVAFHPYSDFLLHDMGSLGDGITQNRATGRLMRTAPLWGSGRRRAFCTTVAPRRSSRPSARTTDRPKRRETGSSNCRPSRGRSSLPFWTRS